MINFYPGPSKLYPQVQSFAADAFGLEILEQNHRSEAFMEMLKVCIEQTKQHLNIPEDYSVFFTSSATECWEITAQSLLRGKVQFLYNGAFGKKWFKYAVTNPQVNSTLNFKKPELRGTRYFVDQKIEEAEIDPENEFLCWVASETSNGTYTNQNSINALKEKSPNALLIVDATSSLGGIDYDISSADIWFASSQKCFGMPSGLGIMVLSPAAIKKAEVVNERNHYNSLLFVKENFDKFQTHYTPNILGIFLFKRLMQTLRNISEVALKLEERALRIYDFFEKHPKFEILVKNEECRSPTIITISTKNPQKIIDFLKMNNIVAGKGYGEWKKNTWRIANFPAIEDREFIQLFKVLEKYV